MKIHPGFGEVVDAYARQAPISVRCTDVDCCSDSGVPEGLEYVGSADELRVVVGDYVYWSNTTEAVR